MDVLKINGAYIAYRHRPGLGRTIVFANSLGSDQSIWDDVIAALPNGYGILTYDLRGHGQSSGLAESIEELADDVSQLIDAVGLTDVLFCGVSIGGMIGQVLSAKRTDVIKASVLCNTAPKIGTMERWAKRIAAVEDVGLAGFASTIVMNWFGPSYTARTDRMALHQTMIGRTSEAGYIAACHAIRDADLTPYAAAIEPPVLCIGGQHDQSVAAESVQALADLIPNGRAKIFEELGHIPSLEMPRELAALIEAFDPGTDNRTDAGMKMRRAVLSDAHMDKASANITSLDAAFQTLITEGAWGIVWASPGISARDITEAFQHVAIYAGVPRANHALKLTKQTLAEMETDD